MSENSDSSIVQKLSTPVDGSTLAVFRMFFSALMIWEVFHFWPRLDYNFLKREFLFHYEFFSFVSPWPGNGLYWHFVVMAIASFCMLLGIWFRISAVVFALCFTYFFLLEKAIYLNHFYFVCLLAWLLACTNADAKWSLPMGQRSRSGTVPMWQIGILRFQLIVVYFYGGLAKLNSDWLAGEPIRHWLRARARPYPKSY